MVQKSPRPTWTDRDSALWHTCEIAVDLANGIIPRPRLEVVASFPPQFGRDEEFLASGPFELFDFHAPGDGTYMHSGSFFFATGAAGLAATAAVAVGRAIGNGSRRRAAEQYQ